MQYLQIHLVGCCGWSVFFPPHTRTFSALTQVNMSINRICPKSEQWIVISSNDTCSNVLLLNNNMSDIVALRDN